MSGALRWKLADAEDDGQGSLFATDELLRREVGTGKLSGLEFLHVNARRIVNEVPAASRMPFRFTINAYRGCSHACVYCFARPTHEYLGLDIGEDFERRLVVKVNAVERLRAELRSARWGGDHIAMGTNTDPYQRCEGKYKITRGLVGVLGEAGNPFSILTKSPLVLRDLDLLVAAAERTSVRVNLSIGTLDERVWRETEPGTPHPRRRVDAVRQLNEAGIPCGVLVAPVIPGMSDGEEQLADVVGACAEAGAVSISSIYLHLRPGVRDHWFGWLAERRPDLVGQYRARYRGSNLVAADREELGDRLRALVEAAGARMAGAGNAREIRPPAADRLAPDPLAPADPGGRREAATAGRRAAPPGRHGADRAPAAPGREAATAGAAEAPTTGRRAAPAGPDPADAWEIARAANEDRPRQAGPAWEEQDLFGVRPS